MNFMGVKSLSPYNGIIGRPGLKAIQAVPSTVHGMLKFPVDGGIITICSTTLIPTECASVTTSSIIPREEKTRPANFTVALHPDFPDQEVVIGGSLSDKGRTELCSVLKKNLDIFAWQPSDMTGVPWSVAEHRLNIREGYSLVRQKKRGQTLKRARAIQAEVQNLVEARIMREVYYHDWLSNPVMKVESLCGYPFKCFLEAYKGYHQIQLVEAGEEKTAFHTGQGVYCYTNMPFGLKNAGATYQRMMDKEFKGQVGRNIEVYVEEHVVKSYTEAEMMRDIEETFRTLRKVNMKLNPKKCSFGLTKGVFLGSGTSFPAAEAALIRATPIGNSPDADLLYKPRVTGSGTKLLANGETGLVTGLRSKKTLTVIVEVLKNKSIKEKEVAAVIEEDGPTWMTQLVDYLKDGVLPGDEKEARKLRLKAYYVMREIHEGSCSIHARPQLVVAKAIRLGPLSGRAGEGQIFDSRHGLLHEVDKSKGSGNNFWQTGEEIHAVNNDEELRLNLDLLEEHRECTAVYEAKAKSKMMKYYNARVRGVAFKPGDFVYRNNDASHAVAGGNLGPKWEGSYEVTEALGDGAYKLWSTNGIIHPKTWNIANLKRYY
nr:reverse transcriptase domain-containing protein [Tanacetum cinerariifolium]